MRTQTPHPAPLIIADDLTGALATAANVKAAGIPSTVVWNEIPESGPHGVVVNARTRDSEDVFEITSKWVRAGIRRGYREFELRVDTSLRGDPAAGIRALTSNLEADEPAVVAMPAFPAANRETREGRQRIRRPDGSWSEIDVAKRLFPDGRAEIVPAPSAVGPTLRESVLSGIADGARTFVADAASEDDLRALGADIVQLRREGVSLITVSSGAWLRYLPSPATYVVVLAGSDSPVLIEQTERLLESQPGEAVVRDLGDLVNESDLEIPEGAKSVFVLNTMAAGAGPGADGENVRDLGLARRAAAEARRLIDLLAKRNAICRGVMVSGGWTAEMLLDALEGEALETHGDPAPLCTLARVRGGAYPGTLVLAKGGSIGHPELLSELLKEMWK